MSSLLEISSNADVNHEPVNITKELRLKANMGLQTFADYARVSQQIVLRTEQGVYSEIPPAIHNALLELAPITSSELHNQYKSYIKQHRLWAQQVKPLDPNLLLEPTVTPLHPLISWRTNCGYESRMSFCTAFCLHSSTITRFEVGESKSVPAIIEELFYDIFDPLHVNSTLAALEDKFKEWNSEYNRVA